LGWAATPVFEERIKHFHRFTKPAKVKVIIFTGGIGDLTTGGILVAADMQTSAEKFCEPRNMLALQGEKKSSDYRGISRAALRSATHAARMSWRK
jgi:hypothetical protein